MPVKPYPEWCFHTETTAFCARHHSEYAARNARQRADKSQRVPAWAERDAIRAIYDECAALNRAGKRMHVDHIIPLKGKRVSGLHVAANLRIIPARENIAKSNRF
jgi:hypothetical protein